MIQDSKIERFIVRVIHGDSMYCHGTLSSYRIGFIGYQWEIKWLGPRGGKRHVNLTPHSQPNICSSCGFIFLFDGCDRFHLGEHESGMDDFKSIHDYNSQEVERELREWELKHGKIIL